MTLVETKKLLAMIRLVYTNWEPKESIDLIAGAWQILLNDYSFADISNAFQAYARQGNQFPPAQPMVLVNLINQVSDTSLSEAEAWAMTYKAICNSSYNSDKEFHNLPEAVQKAVGAPSQLRQWAMDENFNEGVISSNFKRAYRIVLERQKTEAAFNPVVADRLETNDTRRLPHEEV